MILRDYQQAGVDNIRAALARGAKAPLFCAPTGAGKTVTFAYIAANAAAKGKRVAVVVHRAELMAQASRTLASWDVSHGLVSPSHPETGHTVQVAMVQTLANRAGRIPAPDILILDEAHHGVSSTYARLRAAFPDAIVIGFSATPSRLDGKPLAGVFDTLIMGPTVAWLMAQGHLSRCHYYAPPSSLDLSGVRKRAGDFARDDLQAAMDKPKITGEAVNHYRSICPGVPAVVFCVSLAHSAAVVSSFNAAGIPAAGIDGTMTREARAKIVASLAEGLILILVSVELVAEGFDLPAVTAAILMRPTASLGMHLQQIGRVLRVAPGKSHAVVLDMVGNLARHGLADDERQWSLDGDAACKVKCPPSDAVSQCRECFCCYRPAPKCPECGHEAPKKPRKLDTVAGALVRIETISGTILSPCCKCNSLTPEGKPCAECGHDEDDAKRKAARRAQGGAFSLAELIALGKKRGIKRPEYWARMVYNGRRSK